MPITNNCVDVTYHLPSYATGTIQWTLYAFTYWPDTVTGTIANNTWTGCFDEPLDCAELLAQYLPVNDGNDDGVSAVDVHVVWNGVVWAEGTVPLDTQQYDETSVVWIGNECHKDRFRSAVCNYKYNTWLLDVELTTKVSDSPEHSVYWRVYSDFVGHGRSNLLHDPFYRTYQSNTTYRSLHCIEYNGGCTELGLKQGSAVASDPIIRVNGVAKTDHWNCSQDLCNGDIVTPLQGCSVWLSGGAFAGISLVGATLLYLAAAWFFRRNRKRAVSGTASGLLSDDN